MFNGADIYNSPRSYRKNSGNYRTTIEIPLDWDTERVAGRVA